MKPQSLKSGGINEAEWALRIRSFIRTYQFALAISHDPHELIMVFAKNARRVAILLFPIGRYAFKGCKGGRFF